jgi:uncharacterized Zn-binding protein involved in type VI secretion/flagellar motor protein MotB
MGKPGARVTDLAGHGGMISGPGVPMVLVGKMPAATMGDMHVCPMVTGVVPHVGGPTMLGSMGVFIGKKPAARIGDMGVCVGPPGTVAMGAPNVLIGEAGAGSGGGAAAAAAAALAAQVGSPQGIDPIAPLPPPDPAKALHYLNFRFVDAAGLPLPAVPFKLSAPDGQTFEASASPEGEFSQSGFTQGGSYTVELQSFSEAKWSKDAIQVGDSVDFSSKADGFADGTPVIIAFLETVGGGGGRFLEQREVKVQGGQVKGTWKPDLPGTGGSAKSNSEATSEANPDATEPEPADLEPLPERPVYQFMAFAGNAIAVSPALKITQDLEIQLLDEKQDPIGKTGYVVESRTGEVFEGDLNDQGEVTVKGLMPGWHHVRFPDLDGEPGPNLRGNILELEDQTFRHSSVVFLPDAQETAQQNGATTEDKQAAITGLAVLKTVFLRLKEFPDQKLFIVGHTDTSGDDGGNLILSDRRALSAVYLLEGQKEPWAALSKARHKVADIKQILAWAAKTRGWPCDPGGIDESWGNQAATATRRFQEGYNAEFASAIDVDGVVGSQTWGAFFDLYQDELARLLDTTAEGLDSFRASLRWKDPRKSVGCGESWPIDAPEKDNFRSQTNRRVELLFFDPDENFELTCHPADGSCRKNRCPLYPASPGTRSHIPVHPHPRPQSTPTFFTLETPGAANSVRMHSVWAYVAYFKPDQSLESLRRFAFHEGKLCAPGTTTPVPLDCDRSFFCYFSHRDDLLSLDRATHFKADKSGLPLLGPLQMPCGPESKVELDMWQQKDWVLVHASRVDGERPDKVRMAQWREDYVTGFSGTTADGQPGFWPHGNTQAKDNQERWRSHAPIDCVLLGNPGGDPLWAATLSALPTAKVKLLLVQSQAGVDVNVGSFNELKPTGDNIRLRAHHLYDQALVQKLLALDRDDPSSAAIDALPAPKTRSLLPGDMCWQDQGQTNNCGPFSFSTAMNYWFPYTNNPRRKDGALYAKAGNVDDTINGARTPRDIVNACPKFKMNGRDNDAEDLDKARALKLVKLWIQAGVPVVYLSKEEYTLGSYHWKTFAGYDGNRYFINNSGADREVFKNLRRAGTDYEHAPVGNDVDPELDFYGKWHAAGGDIVDAFTSVDRCTFIPLFPQDTDFAGPHAE